jgi:hypothetical protein
MKICECCYCGISADVGENPDIIEYVDGKLMCVDCRFLREAMRLMPRKEVDRIVADGIVGGGEQ